MVAAWTPNFAQFLDALDLNHGLRIVHGAVWLENCVVYLYHASRRRVLLIDFGCAIDTEPEEKPVLYEGGSICCPLVLAGCTVNTLCGPALKHDFVGSVLMLNMYMFPVRIRR